MDNDKDGARWRLWCRALTNPDSEISTAIERRIVAARCMEGHPDVVRVMTAALDEVLELYPEE